MAERDPLSEVREGLDQAHAAADRLVRDAHRRAEEAARAANADVPPRGWESPGAEPRPALPDLELVHALLDSLRHSLPPELSRQLAEALRDVLLALRALIDWYLRRLGGEEPATVAVEDIPLD